MTTEIKLRVVSLSPNIDGTFTFSDFQQHLVQATLDFANMQVIPRALDVDNLFATFGLEMWVLARPRMAKQLLHRVQTRRWSEQSYPRFDHRTKETYSRQKRELCIALADIVKKDLMGEKLLSQLDQRLKGITFQLGLVAGSLVYKFSVSSVSAGWALGLVLLRESAYPLRRCKCDRYFAIFNPKKHRQRYCSDCAEEARRDGAAKRQRAWRQKKRGKK